MSFLRKLDRKKGKSGFKAQSLQPHCALWGWGAILNNNPDFHGVTLFVHSILPLLVLTLMMFLMLIRRLQMRMKLILAALFLAGAIPAFAQVRPAAKENRSQLAVGAGFSYFNTEMYNKFNLGPAVWADWNIGRGPSLLKGFGVEAEFRQIQYRQVQDAHYYQTTFGGGPIYSLRRYRNFRPYGKFIVDCGHMNFKIAKFPPRIHKRYLDSLCPRRWGRVSRVAQRLGARRLRVYVLEDRILQQSLPQPQRRHYWCRVRLRS